MPGAPVNAAGALTDFCGKAMAAAGFDFFMLTSFWSDKNFNCKMCAGGAVIGFEPARVADAAFRVVHEADEGSAVVLCAIPVGIHAELIGKIFGAQARARFLHDDGQPVLIQEERRARRPFGVARRPLIGADVVELDPQERIEQILHVEFVFDGQCGSVFASEAKLPGDGMEAMTETFHKFQQLLGAVRPLDRRGNQRCGKHGRRQRGQGKRWENGLGWTVLRGGRRLRVLRRLMSGLRWSRTADVRSCRLCDRRTGKIRNHRRFE